jgi:uncharacterized protein (DUF58 family)
VIDREILKKVQKIEITTRSLVNDIFSGEYHSVFKGRGMEFAEVREYFPGDDVRNIDWNVTARMGHPYVKQFMEERELTVMLLVDASSSSEFGSVHSMKGEIAAEISAVLAFSAIRNNDRVGLIIFTDRIEKFVPPKKGKTHVLRVIRELLYYRPQNRRTDISAALEYLNHVNRRKCILFLVSDFLSEGFERSLEITGRKHDVICISITDPREIEMPGIGFIELEDSETGEVLLIDTSDAHLRNRFYAVNSARIAERRRLFRSMNIDSIDIFLDRSYVEPLIAFFRIRARKFR